MLPPRARLRPSEAISIDVSLWHSSLFLQDRGRGSLTVTRHVVIPVRKRALGVIAPRPYVQLEERWDVEPVRTGDVVEDLPLEDRRRVVLRQPFGRVEDEFDAHQSQ